MCNVLPLFKMSGKRLSSSGARSIPKEHGKCATKMGKKCFWYNCGSIVKWNEKKTFPGFTSPFVNWDVMEKQGLCYRIS